jgi:NAD(P)-dependent dehydrogenase (short-subunit alcohol dehydrogenase family)
MVEAAVDALGGLDVLVNNAGISGSTAPVEKSDPDEWEKVVQVNLIGTFNVTRLAIPHLKKSSAGVIIIMSSGAGRFGVRATPRDLLIIATHLERVADDPNTPHTLTVLFGHVAAAIGRGCRTVLPPIPFQILLEQTEAMLDGAWGKNFDALYAEMMSFQEPPDDDSEPATGPLT